METPSLRPQLKKRAVVWIESERSPSLLSRILVSILFSVEAATTFCDSPGRRANPILDLNDTGQIVGTARPELTRKVRSQRKRFQHRRAGLPPESGGRGG